MGWFKDTWNKFNRLFHSSCPHCGVSDYDLAPEDMPQVQLVCQEKRYRQGIMTNPRVMMVKVPYWAITEKFRWKSVVMSGPHTGKQFSKAILTTPPAAV